MEGTAEVIFYSFFALLNMSIVLFVCREDIAKWFKKMTAVMAETTETAKKAQKAQ